MISPNRKNRIDIYDIPIAELTDQYLNYLKNISEHQLDLASEFLVMASTLLSIKSKMLLPTRQNQDDELELATTEDESDPREELVQKLLEYKKFKEISLILKAKEQEQEKILKRPPTDLSYLWADDFSISGVTLEDLKLSIKTVLNKDSNRELQTPKIPRDPIPLSRKIREVYKTLRQFNSKVFFGKLYGSKTSKAEVIVTFLAVLELIKMKKIAATQEKPFGEIVLSCREV